MKGKEAKQAGGWYFVPLTICVPTELQDALTNILEDDAQTGVGLFANETKIEKEDEALDGLLCVEAYNCKHSFTKYLATLKQYNVAGKDGAFLKKDFTLYLFTLLKHCANIINENTDSPQRCKNSLNDVIAGLDKVTIWGLFFQILLLNGLCKTLESIDLNEGDNGFDEAQDLHDWLFLALLEKLTWFCNGFYGENDLKQLSPLCEYLCTTEAGKIVQDWIKQKYYPEKRQNVDEATPYYEKAVSVGLLEKTGTGYRRKGITKAQLAYFLGRVHTPDATGKDGKVFPETELNALFGEKRLGQTLRELIDNKSGKPRGYKIIDALFD